MVLFYDFKACHPQWESVGGCAKGAHVLAVMMTTSVARVGSTVAGAWWLTAVPSVGSCYYTWSHTPRCTHTETGRKIHARRQPSRCDASRETSARARLARQQCIADTV
jgi:hypothetical protein